MGEYKNIFKDKSEAELRVLYEQFLESERTGVTERVELREALDMYIVWFGVSGNITMQYDLLNAIADKWYNDRNE